MGQQQLILLVIGVVLVALAVTAAFQVLQHGFRQDEADGLLDRALTIAHHAAAWKATNEHFGGGNGSYERLATSGLQALALGETTVRGRFAITAATARRLEVSGVSTRYPGVGVRVFVTDYGVDSSRVSFSGDVTVP